MSGVCGEGWISAFDAFSPGPTKQVGEGTKTFPVLDDEEIVVIGRRRSLLDRIGGAIADTLGFDGQFLYDGYSPDRRFSLGGLGRAFSGANSFYLEYNPWSPVFNMRGDAGRTYSTFGAAIVDSPAAIGRAFNNAINAPLVTDSQLAYWGGGIREARPTPTFGEFVGPVLGEMTGVPALSRARDHFQAVEHLSAIGDQAGAISHAQSFMLDSGSAALTFTGYTSGARAIAGEMGVARAAADELRVLRALDADVAAAGGMPVRRFASSDPLVADLANEIEAAYPQHVRHIGLEVYDSAGLPITDLDIVLRNSVIQVKDGAGTGLITQLRRTEQLTSLPAIGWGPTLKPSIVAPIRREGYLVTTDRGLLIETVKP